MLHNINPPQSLSFGIVNSTARNRWSAIDGFSVQALASGVGLRAFDLVKIDVEGGEQEIILDAVESRGRTMAPL